MKHLQSFVLGILTIVLMAFLTRPDSREFKKNYDFTYSVKSDFSKLISNPQVNPPAFYGNLPDRIILPDPEGTEIKIKTKNDPDRAKENRKLKPLIRKDLPPLHTI